MLIQQHEAPAIHQRAPGIDTRQTVGIAPHQFRLEKGKAEPLNQNAPQVMRGIERVAVHRIRFGKARAQGAQIVGPERIRYPVVAEQRRDARPRSSMCRVRPISVYDFLSLGY